MAMSEVVLTGDQAVALRAMQGFVLGGGKKCFLLKGYAGTGKTFLIRCLADWLVEERLSFALMAPTGRAAKVLGDKTGHVAGTIHRSIYNLDKLLEIPNAKAEDRFKYYFELKSVGVDERPRVIMVDESSMVSNRLSDDKFFRFGSGHLLEDLMEFAGLEDPISKCKLIFVGDPAQLPPIGMNFSPALDADYLREIFEVSSREGMLREVVRQQEGSAILETATQIRSDIEMERFNRLHIEADGREILEATLKDVQDLWERECPPDQELSVTPPLVCVTYKNETALHYNASVRSRLHGGGDGLHPVRARDYLMVVANNRRTGLLNGELVLVKSVDGELEVHRLGIKTLDGPKQVELKFRNITIIAPSIHGGYVEIPTMIMENVLYGKDRDVTEHELIAQWVFFKNRHPELRPGTGEFTETIGRDPYFNALRVKFGYAVTCHKAQGGEWPTAVVVFERMDTSLDGLRWNYTAVTRGKERLYGVELPRILPFGGWGDEGGQAEAADEGERVEGGADVEDLRKAGFPEGLDWVGVYHRALVREWEEAGVVVDRVEVREGDHFFRYFLKKEGSEVRVQVYFTDRRELRPQPFKAAGFPEPKELMGLCQSCLERALEGVARAQDGGGERGVADELKEAEGLMRRASEQAGGELRGVEHFNYRERYVVATAGGRRAVLDWTYDGRKVFKRRPSRVSGDEGLAESVMRELEMLIGGRS